MHTTVAESQRADKFAQLDALIADQPRTCGTAQQFAAIQGTFLRDIKWVPLSPLNHQPRRSVVHARLLICII
jgi:hypothetical protein